MQANKNYFRKEINFKVAGRGLFTEGFGEASLWFWLFRFQNVLLQSSPQNVRIMSGSCRLLKQCVSPTSRKLLNNLELSPVLSSL